MKPKQLAEPTGRMVNNHGHWEYIYDDPTMNRPPPPAKEEPPKRKLRAVPADPPSPPPAAYGPTALPEPFKPVHLKPRHDGWTAERQRTFLIVLAETGSVSLACRQAGVSSRSAYRLRAHAKGAGFAHAWDAALKLATARLTALAFERATRGTVKETWVDGELKSTTRAPSDKLLMFLLQHLLPAGRPGDRWDGFEAMGTLARGGFPGQLEALADADIEMIPLDSRDFFPEPPGLQDEDV